jgi:glycosyltransferase involved in cell wall biosynthesis
MKAKAEGAGKDKTFRIFQLGTNNWQSPLEFAPGSGILHADHHNAYNKLPNTKCWSIFPSNKQKTKDLNREDVRVFELDHPIPICESVSPTSNYRWHSMSDAEFDAYRTRLFNEVSAFMADIEAKEGAPFDLCVAHHTFLNPLVMRDVVRARAKKKGQTKEEPVVVFVHGTALKMYVHEKEGKEPEEYPNRFYPMMIKERVFHDMAGVFAISAAQVDAFFDVFGEDQLDRDRVVVSANGIKTDLFKPDPSAKRAEILGTLQTVPAPGSDKSVQVITDPDYVIMFCGKFAKWKRLDAVLLAAVQWEKAFKEKGKTVATLVVGSGPENMQTEYNKQVEDLGLTNTYLIGPKPHDVLAKLYNISDVGVFPSYREPMGLVFIECMACGTPVVGAASGGPLDFVDESVGALIPACDIQDDGAYFDAKFVDTLSETVQKAITDGWKAKKGAACTARAVERYGIKKQVTELLAAAVAFPSRT